MKQILLITGLMLIGCSTQGLTIKNPLAIKIHSVEIHFVCKGPDGKEMVCDKGSVALSFNNIQPRQIISTDIKRQHKSNDPFEPAREISKIVICPHEGQYITIDNVNKQAERMTFAIDTHGKITVRMR
ncbi:hypothetical protein JW872_00070 [Candidatus Babeliales bacterium]|nr:hypothetical protein [Candidatus Babeliales bacterium]